MSARPRGFTLIEVLVALFIAVVMATMGYAAINQAVRNRDSLRQQQAHLLELQNAMRVIEQDFVQLASRPVRQALGEEPAQPALQGGAQGTQTDTQTGTQRSAQPIVALTRAGWANPAGLQRPGLQRVAYFLENGTLRREHWQVLDPTLASTTVTRDLLTHVKGMGVRYLDFTHQWVDQWPPLTNAVQLGPQMEFRLRQRPLAVEIRLDTEDWDQIVRIIEIAG